MNKKLLANIFIQEFGVDIEFIFILLYTKKLQWKLSFEGVLEEVSSSTPKRNN